MLRRLAKRVVRNRFAQATSGRTPAVGPVADRYRTTCRRGDGGDPVQTVIAVLSGTAIPIGLRRDVARATDGSRNGDPFGLTLAARNTPVVR